MLLGMDGRAAGWPPIAEYTATKYDSVRLAAVAAPAGNGAADYTGACDKKGLRGRCLGPGGPRVLRSAGRRNTRVESEGVDKITTMTYVWRMTEVEPGENWTGKFAGGEMSCAMRPGKNGGGSPRNHENYEHQVKN